MTELTPADYGKVAVLMGGWAAEREVSLNSGQAVLTGLQAKNVDAHGVDANRDVLRVLEKGRYDRVFNIIHGRGGEDGVIQAALELLGIPYTGSGVLGSAVCMNKILTKKIFIGSQLPTPEFQLITSDSEVNDVTQRLGLPLMMKPALEGSSIGVTKVKQADDLKHAWQAATEYCDEVFAERWIYGKEYTVAIVGNDVLPVIRLETPHQFYDYQAKYFSDDTNYICPCGLSEQQEQELQVLAKNAFDAVDASGWGRVDVMVDETDRPWLLEINTVPGMTDHSLVPMAAKARQIEFEDLVLRILDTSFIERG